MTSPFAKDENQAEPGSPDNPCRRLSAAGDTVEAIQTLLQEGKPCSTAYAHLLATDVPDGLKGWAEAELQRDVSASAVLGALMEFFQSFYCSIGTNVYAAEADRALADYYTDHAFGAIERIAAYRSWEKDDAAEGEKS